MRTLLIKMRTITLVLIKIKPVSIFRLNEAQILFAAPKLQVSKTCTVLCKCLISLTATHLITDQLLILILMASSELSMSVWRFFQLDILQLTS